MTTLTRSTSRSGAAYKDYVNFLGAYKRNPDAANDSFAVPNAAADVTDFSKNSCVSYNSFLENTKNKKFNSVKPNLEEKKSETKTEKSEIFIEIQPRKSVSEVSKIFENKEKSPPPKSKINAKIDVFERQISSENKPKLASKPVINRPPPPKIEIEIKPPPPKFEIKSSSKETHNGVFPCPPPPAMSQCPQNGAGSPPPPPLPPPMTNTVPKTGFQNRITSPPPMMNAIPKKTIENGASSPPPPPPMMNAMPQKAVQNGTSSPPPPPPMMNVILKKPVQNGASSPPPMTHAMLKKTIENGASSPPPPPPMMNTMPKKTVENGASSPPPPPPMMVKTVQNGVSAPPPLHAAPKMQATLNKGPQIRHAVSNPNGAIPNEIDRNDPMVRKLVYGTLRGLYGAYHDKANYIMATLPKDRVKKSNGVQDIIDKIASNGDLEKLNGRVNPKLEE